MFKNVRGLDPSLGLDAEIDVVIEKGVITRAGRAAAWLLALVVAAINARLIRSAMLEVLRQDFVLFAKSKGLTRRRINFRHVLRNALIPTLTIIGLQLGFLISGAFIIENVFGWPGIGRLAVEAIHARDYPLIQGTVLLSSILFVSLTLAVDLVYCVLDPRIDYAKR